MTINTVAEQILSAKRFGARTVRQAIQKKIQQLRVRNTNTMIDPEPPDVHLLNLVDRFIVGMVKRDRKRKGGLWN